MRDKSGRFVKGYSGNAGGRPRDEHNIAALARSYSTEAIETLVDLKRNARDDRVRGTAAQALLDRGFRKPKVEIQNTNADFRDALEQVQKRLAETHQLCCCDCAALIREDKVSRQWLFNVEAHRRC